MLNPNMTRVWADNGFYELTATAITKGAAFLGEHCILFSPVGRYLAPTSYDRAIDLGGWIAGGSCKIANDIERAFCLAIKDDITSTFQPSGHE